MIKPRGERRVAAVALVTTMTVGLGTSLMFLVLMAASSADSLVARIATGLVVLSEPFGAGAAWAWAIALLYGVATKPATKTGALAFGGMVLAMGVPIDLTQLWLDDLPGWMPYRMHGYFTIVFMLGIGVIAGVASARLTRRLGIADYRRVGVWTGFWAGLGLLPGSVLGYVAGFPINGIRFNMVWSIVIAVLVSALIGGLAFGVLLDRRTPGERSDRSPMLTGRYTGS